MSTFASVEPHSVLNGLDDRLEKEADSVSEQIDASSHATHLLDRTHSQRDKTPRSGREGSNAAGNELDSSTLADMEPRLGFDLSQVRIHADAAAAASADAISARAFTSGTDVVFAAGQYRPDTAEGRKLLAHELTHVAQQRGRPAMVQRKVYDKQSLRSNWGTAPAIVKVEAQQGYTGPSVGYYANGDTTPIEIVKNTMGLGTYTLSDAGSAKGPADADYVLNESPRFAFSHPVANLHPKIQVTVVIKAKDRFAALPDYIQNYLLRTNESTDREELADEGERLLREGTTAADVASASDLTGAIEVSSEEDLVDSLRRRGFTDFPTRDEYYRRLAWQMANTSDFRRWWTKDDIADYWREFPEEAATNWNAFAGRKFTEAKEAEAAKWLEAFRRIDAAAGVVDAIAIVTLVAVGGFLTGPSIASGVRVIQSGSIQGVSVGVWAKTFAGAGLSAGYLSAILTRSEEAAEHGDANPISIFAAAVNDALGSGKVYEAITNESLLTGKDLKKSTSERIIGGLTGGLELGFNFLGAKDFVPEYSPNVKPPVTPTPETPSPTAPETTSVSTSDPMLAKPAMNTNTPAPRTNDPWLTRQPANTNTVDDITAARLKKQTPATPLTQEANVHQVPMAATGTGEVVGARTIESSGTGQADSGALGTRMSSDKPTGSAVTSGTVGPVGPAAQEPMTPARADVSPPVAAADQPPVAQGPQTRVITDIAPGKEVDTTVATDRTAVVRHDGREVTIDIDAPNTQRMAQELGITRKQAAQVVQDVLADVGRAPRPRKVLMSFAQDRGNVVGFLQDRLRDPSGFWESDAFARPPAGGTRINARVGAGNYTLSDYALVFEEAYPGQFTPKTSATTAVTEYQFVQGGPGQRVPGAQVYPRAVVRVNDSGEIVEIVDDVFRGTAQERRAAVVALLKGQGWTVRLAQ